MKPHLLLIIGILAVLLVGAANVQTDSPGGGLINGFSTGGQSVFFSTAVNGNGTVQANSPFDSIVITGTRSTVILNSFPNQTLSISGVNAVTFSISGANLIFAANVAGTTGSVTLNTGQGGSIGYLDSVNQTYTGSPIFGVGGTPTGLFLAGTATLAAGTTSVSAPGIVPSSRIFPGSGPLHGTTTLGTLIITPTTDSFTITSSTATGSVQVGDTRVVPWISW